MMAEAERSGKINWLGSLSELGDAINWSGTPHGLSRWLRKMAPGLVAYHLAVGPTRKRLAGNLPEWSVSRVFDAIES